MNIEFKCPQCGQTVEADESDRGQVAACPHCGKGIVVPRGKPRLAPVGNVGMGGRAERSIPSEQNPFKPTPPPREQVAIPKRFARPTQDEAVPPNAPRAKSLARKIIVILLVVIGLAVMAGVASYGGYLYFGDMPRLERGILCYEKKAYTKAFKLLLPLAKKGYAKAQLYVGDCYANGNGVTFDAKEALKWYGKAEGQSLAEVTTRISNYGWAYYKSRQYDRAFPFLIHFARTGNAKAQLCLGDCYANGRGVIMDTAEAARWYRSAADMGCAEAQHRMFVCCRDGVGIERNRTNAAKWCRRAADAGFEEAMFDMGMLYLKGEGVEMNGKSAFRWFRKGAERGYPPALYTFGQCYKHGVGAEKDEDEAFKWQNKAVNAWRASANLGDTDSMVRLANLYKEGDVVELDKEEAVKWFRKGAELGNETAQCQLALCYHNGEGVEEDQEESAKWMQKAAEKSGDREVQWIMGRYYQEGWGLEKDMTTAVKWFERSAKKGFPPAQYSLAMCYLNGDGVKADAEKAEELLEDAADSGNKDAQQKLSEIKSEKAEKAQKVEQLSDIEKKIAERKERINDILKGRLKGEWLGFDAGKITMIAPSVSVVEEQPWKSVADGLSEDDAREKIDRTLVSVRKEAERLEERLKAITRVKSAYDAKELESRKEKCASCEGKGRVKCARCQGSGAVTSTERKECPTCCDSERKGQVCSRRRCGKCGGSGQITPRCNTCNGKGVVRGSDRDLSGKIRLDTRETCSSCGGSKKGYPISCPGCSGRGEVNIWQTCATCRGQGVIASGEKETCPVCDGKGDLKCERCDGRGITYRPKDVDSTKLSD